MHQLTKTSYDIIGDIHGQAVELVDLLYKMSYRRVNGVYQHKSRKIIFLGDFIDRGDYQKKVIKIVRPMIEFGHALAIMGNHEYNAIAYHTMDQNTGEYLRSHSEMHKKQHQAFLKAYKDNDKGLKNTIEWFKTLPLWIELEGIRVIHACWDKKWINKIKSPILSDDLLLKSTTIGTWQKAAVETLLKGKEVLLPDGISFKDADGNSRVEIRSKWWDADATTYKETFLGSSKVRDALPNEEIGMDSLVEYDANERLLFFGHYWMDGSQGIEPLADNIACLDFSVARKAGKLVAYRFDGETKIDTTKFVSVERV